MSEQQPCSPVTRPSRSRLVLAALLGAAALGLLLQVLLPADLPSQARPTVIETVFDNRGVILAARLLLVLASFVLAVGGAFILGSIVVRVRNGHWLRRVGPFEVSETAVSDVATQIESWRAAALSRQRTLDELLTLYGSAERLLSESDRKDS